MNFEGGLRGKVVATVFTAASLFSACEGDTRNPTLPPTLSEPEIGTPSIQINTTAQLDTPVPNDRNRLGHYAPEAQRNECAPFLSPSWSQQKQLEFRCVDPSGDEEKELRVKMQKISDDESSIHVVIKQIGESKKIYDKDISLLGSVWLAYPKEKDPDCFVALYPGNPPTAEYHCDK